MLELHDEPDPANEPLGGNYMAAFVPSYRTLAGFADEGTCSDGIALESLAPGTTLLVRTRNSDYQLTVVDGAEHQVLVQGGAHLLTATPGFLQGATAGGSLVKTGWIGVDHRMELCCDSRRIVTSPVRSITITGGPAF